MKWTGRADIVDAKDNDGRYRRRGLATTMLTIDD